MVGEPVDVAISMFIDSCEDRGIDDPEEIVAMWERLHELIPEVTPEHIISELSEVKLIGKL